MRSLHERVLAAPAAAVGPLLDGLGRDGDRLWPAPAWPSMRLDRPLAVGADGGHGPIRYVVSAYQPGRRVEFRTHPGIGLVGFHAFEVEPLDQHSCLLRHVLDAELRGRMRWLMPLAVRWLHDAVVEDLLDNAERAVTGAVARPHHHSLWVRTLRRRTAARARLTSIPAAAALMTSALPRVDYGDAYSIVAPAGVSANPRAWVHAFFAGLPRWAGADLPQLAETDREVLLGADESHLSYRAGLLVEASAERVTVTVSTVVQLHTRAGRAYFAVVRRFHPLLIRLLLRRAALRMSSQPVAEVSTIA